MTNLVKESDRSRIVEQVRLWGGATSDAILDPSMVFFTLPGAQGFISYRLAGNTALVYGDPTCSKEQTAELALAFQRYIEKQGKRTIYISASPQFADWAIKNTAKTLIEFGDELILDPRVDPLQKSGTYGSLLRRKVKRAQREGVTIHEYVGSDLEIEKKIEELSHTWKKNRRGMQLHISNIYQFDDRYGKRWFYAKRGSQIVGVVTLNQLKQRQGWLLNHLMMSEEAPNGTSELLIVETLDRLRKEGCSYVTVGTVTNQTLGKIVGLNWFATWIARQIFNIARVVVNLDGLNMFWTKFHPQRESSYLLFTHGRISLGELIDLKRALKPKQLRKEDVHG